MLSSRIISKYPIVLCPGFCGSKLVLDKCHVDTSLKKAAIKNKILVKNDFVNLNMFDSGWQEKFSLKYDPTIGYAINDSIDVHDFGGVEGLRNLCDDCGRIDNVFNYLFRTEVINKVYHYKYFDLLIGRLEEFGYEPSVNLFGAPYDFRKIMVIDYLELYFKKLKLLIENAFDKENKKVVIVSHSIGCLITYFFLVNYCDRHWKNKYIQKFVSVAGPYGGCSVALRTFISGIPNLNLLKDRYGSVIQNSTGLILALPNECGYNKHDLLIYNEADCKRYSILNYPELLPDTSQHIFNTIVKSVIASFHKNTHVPTTFVTTLDQQTQYSYVYNDLHDGTLNEPKTVFTRCAGDNVIHAKSLLFHKLSYKFVSNYAFVHILNSEHTKILHTKELFDIIVNNT